jgi:hypothetical protein
VNFSARLADVTIAGLHSIASVGVVALWADVHPTQTNLTLTSAVLILAFVWVSCMTSVCELVSGYHKRDVIFGGEVEVNRGTGLGLDHIHQLAANATQTSSAGPV